jgi:hypothetical protein
VFPVAVRQARGQESRKRADGGLFFVRHHLIVLSQKQEKARWLPTFACNARGRRLSLFPATVWNWAPNKKEGAPALRFQKF